jgi:hypothetical protein
MCVLTALVLAGLLSCQRKPLLSIVGLLMAFGSTFVHLQIGMECALRVVLAFRAV